MMGMRASAFILPFELAITQKMLRARATAAPKSQSKAPTIDFTALSVGDCCGSIGFQPLLEFGFVGFVVPREKKVHAPLPSKRRGLKM